MKVTKQIRVCNPGGLDREMTVGRDRNVGTWVVRTEPKRSKMKSWLG